MNNFIKSPIQQQVGVFPGRLKTEGAKCELLHFILFFPTGNNAAEI